MERVLRTICLRFDAFGFLAVERLFPSIQEPYHYCQRRQNHKYHYSNHTCRGVQNMELRNKKRALISNQNEFTFTIPYVVTEKNALRQENLFFLENN